MLMRMIAIGGVCLFSTFAHAERADRDKPMQVNADHATYNDLTQRNDFTGNVIITKGTLTIRADHVVVIKTPEGYQLATAYGKPATYRQKSDSGDDVFLEGEGLELYYDSKADTVKFVKQAAARRLQNNALVDEVKGAVVRYDGKTETYVAESSLTGDVGKNSGRVTVTLMPNSKPKSASEGAANSAQPTGSTGSKKNRAPSLPKLVPDNKIPSNP